jgi:hypothetical protein
MTTAATAPLSFADSGQCLGSAQSWGVTLGDLDDDGDLDAFVANAMQGGVGNVVWLNDGQSGFILGEQSGGYGQGVVLGDVDGDNDLDALVGSWWGEETSLVWLNDGSGSFAASGQTLGSGRCFDAALGDLDGDGDLNALIAHGDRRRGSGGRVWLNDGRGHFGDSDLRLSDSHSSDVALGDLDGDGDLDALSHTANCGRRAVVEWLIQYG